MNRLQLASKVALSQGFACFVLLLGLRVSPAAESGRRQRLPSGRDLLGQWEAEVSAAIESGAAKEITGVGRAHPSGVLEIHATGEALLRAGLPGLESNGRAIHIGFDYPSEWINEAIADAIELAHRMTASPRLEDGSRRRRGNIAVHATAQRDLRIVEASAAPVMMLQVAAWSRKHEAPSGDRLPPSAPLYMWISLKRNAFTKSGYTFDRHAYDRHRPSDGPIRARRMIHSVRP